MGGKNRNKRQYGNLPGADGYRLVGSSPSGPRPKGGGNGNGGNTGGGRAGTGNGGNGGGGGNNLAKQLQQFLQQHLRGNKDRPANGNGAPTGNSNGAWRPRWTKEEWAKWNAEQAARSNSPEQAASTVNAGDPAVPKAVRDPEQDARTDGLRQRLQKAVQLLAVVSASDSATPEVIAMHQKIVDDLRAQLRSSKPAEDLYAGGLKKLEQLEEKLSATREQAGKEWSKVDAQVQVAKKVDEKCTALVEAIAQARSELPTLAQAAGAQPPKPKFKKIFDDFSQFITVEGPGEDNPMAAAIRQTLQKAMVDAEAMFAATHCANVAAQEAKGDVDAHGDNNMGQQPVPPADPPKAATAPETTTTATAVGNQAASSGANTSGCKTDTPTEAAATGSTTPAAAIPSATTPPTTNEHNGAKPPAQDSDNVEADTILATAKSLATDQQYDSKAVLDERSALRGRLLGSADASFLQQGIDAVQRALRLQAEADDVAPPTKHARRAGDDNGSNGGNNVDDEL